MRCRGVNRVCRPGFVTSDPFKITVWLLVLEGFWWPPANEVAGKLSNESGSENTDNAYQSFQKSRVSTNFPEVGKSFITFHQTRSSGNGSLCDVTKVVIQRLLTPPAGSATTSPAATASLLSSSPHCLQLRCDKLSQHC